MWNERARDCEGAVRQRATSEVPSTQPKLCVECPYHDIAVERIGLVFLNDWNVEPRDPDETKPSASEAC